MKFNATTWMDRHYKKVSWFAVIVVSLLVLGFYCKVPDKSDMFIPSTFYALFLFAIGVFNSNRASRIDSLFIDRVDIYLNLKRAKELFNALSFSSDYEKTKSNIFWFQAFSGRLPQPDAPKIHYVKEKGFSFKSDKLNIEKEYCELYSKLIKTLQKDISLFLKDNHIQLQKNNLTIDASIFLNSQTWYEATFIVTDDNRAIISKFIAEKILELRADLSKLAKLKRKIDKLYRGYKEDIDKNILSIQKMYGVKLTSYIAEDNGRRADMDFFIEQMETLKNEIVGYVEHNDDKLDACSDKLDDVTDDLNKIYNALMQQTDTD